MNQQFLLLYDYNIWANERVISYLRTLPGDLFLKEVDLGFKSIAEVVGHLISVDEIWFSRIKEESPSSLVTKQIINLDDASNYMNKLQSQIREYLLKISEFNFRDNSTGCESWNLS